MYAVGIVNFGNGRMRVPCGNQGLQKLHNKTMRGWKSETDFDKQVISYRSSW